MTGNDPRTDSRDDRTAIVDLTIAYCWALDEHDWPALRSVFLPDARAELGFPEVTGVDAIVGIVSDVLTPLDTSQHMVTNHQVRVDGDTATSRCYFHAQHVRRAAAEGPNFIVAGRYEDDLVAHRPPPVGADVARGQPRRGARRPLSAGQSST
jgi:hypothetical protein